MRLTLPEEYILQILVWTRLKPVRLLSISPTLTGHNCNIRWCDKCFLSKQDIINISTFPQDYKFPSESLETITYICGMSVPPLMIKRIANRIKEFITSYKIIKE